MKYYLVKLSWGGVSGCGVVDGNRCDMSGGRLVPATTDLAEGGYLVVAPHEYGPMALVCKVCNCRAYVLSIACR